MSTDRIAIIGMAVRCSGAADRDQFWQLVLEGRQSARLARPRETEVPAPLAGREDFVPLSNPVVDFDRFDAAFFGFGEREAEVMDPQRRMLFETAWAAFEDAGQVPGAARTGTYVAVNQSEYFLLNLASRPDLFDVLGGMLLGTMNGQDFPATHLAYKFDLRGPALNINTACSGSLVAVHSAVNALLSHECDLAVAGGASLVLAQRFGYVHKTGGINSRQGRCRPFDADADGTIPGSGAAVVLLKRLDDALRDGDPIHAVIRGTAVNNDGAGKVGFTAPSRDGQVEVIREALAVADVEPDQLGFLETHGTGTALGDALELDALQAVFGTRHADRPLMLGALKASTGHLNAAAGASALIKTVLALVHQCVPPLANFARSPAQVDLDQGPLRAPRRALPWPAEAGPRLAGVSSFGIGGTNAHVIVEEAPPAHVLRASARPQVLVASARTAPSLRDTVERLVPEVTRNQGALADIAYTLAVGRKTHAWRSAAVGADATAVGRSLRDAVQAPACAEEGIGPVAFLIAGQGENCVAGLRALYQWEEAFRRSVDQCREYLVAIDAVHQTVFWNDVLQSPDPLPPRFDDTDYQQPLLFVFAYAQARLLESWGVRPACVMGHSLGEYVAACLAGLFSLDDALRLVHARGIAMQATPPGEMLAVFCPEAAAIGFATRSGADIAACNGAMNQVLAGSATQIADVERWALEDGWQSRRLRVTRAFHSHLIEPALDALRSSLSMVRFGALKVPLVGNLDAAWNTGRELADVACWVAHARQAVRFADSLQTLAARGIRTVLEIGPGTTLTRLAQAHATAANLPLRIADIPGAAHDTTVVAYRRLAGFWCAGGEVNWRAFYSGESRRRIHLPGYAFERRRYWIERAAAPCATPQDECAGWLYRPVWRPCDLRLSPGGDTASWLVFDDGSVDGLAGLCEILRGQGHGVVRIAPGSQFAVLAQKVTMRGGGDDLIRLATYLAATGSGNHRILYGWSLAQNRGGAGDLSFLLGLSRHVLRSGDRPAGDVLAVIALSSGQDGEVEPTRAALAGALRVIAQEVSGVRTRFIVVDNSSELSCVPAAVGGTESFRELWLSAQWMARDYIPARPEETAAAQAFRPDGKYLVVGGQGKVGQILTTALSAQMPLQLALLGRHPLPAGSGVEEIDLTRPRVDARRIVLAAAGFVRAPAADDTAIAAAHDALARLSVAIVQAYVARHLPRFAPGARYRVAEVAATLCPATPLRRIAQVMVRVLVDGGVFIRDEDTVVVATVDGHPPAQIERELALAHPDFAGPARRLLHCAAHFDDVLHGRRSGVSVLYPDGSARFLRATAPGHLAQRDFRDAVDRLRRTLTELAASTGGRPLRILEIGGGNGSLTRQLAPLLNTLNVSYCFTDIGPSFVQGGRRLAAENGYEWISARVFDIEGEPASQGFSPGEFDVIIGFNVLHIAARLERAIDNLSTLLSAGGTFALVETMQWMPWTELVWGLTDDWWRYEDLELRSDGPLLEASAWQHVFEKMGFAVSRVVARQGAADGLVLAAVPPPDRCAAILSSSEAAAQRGAHLRRLVNAGSTVVYYRGDASDPEDVRRLQDALLHRFGALDGVVYAATTGMRAMALLDDIDQRHVGAELAIKADGLVHLDSLCAALRPAFVAVMSSMSSILGGIGHFGYATANGFQDAWCRNRATHTGTRWFAVNWDAWGDADKTFGASVARHGMGSDEAVRALCSALRCQPGQWLVSRHSLDERMDQWLGRAATSGPSTDRDAAAAPGGNESILQQMIALWRELLGRGSPVEASSDFRALGGFAAGGAAGQSGAQPVWQTCQPRRIRARTDRCSSGVAGGGAARFVDAVGHVGAQRWGGCVGLHPSGWWGNPVLSLACGCAGRRTHDPCGAVTPLCA
ncbi:acyltransferase domain-containing protein [Tahibacter amnicola]|uniref:Acyltransferase domain-containing protein n=1 Tax=Tahibacter amnicola TaxID=2976241 RepID=A0ABY6BCD6_9GAMM|nr:type I polyketide synthase [Tahibacter amnicola]UXI66281.1 acyltransferase domain-containing protein [Tahibacter amnicola]